MGTNRERFRRYAMQIGVDGTAFDDVNELGDGRIPVYIVPAPFCIGSYINDPRYHEDDRDFTIANRLASKREPNVEFMIMRTIASPRALLEYDNICISAIKQIRSGDELFVDYGKDDYHY